MLKKNWVWIVTVLVAAGVFCGPVIAAEDAAADTIVMEQKVSYNKRMMDKLAFGLLNVVNGWTEIITEPVEAVQEKRMVWAGVAEGVFNGVFDTAIGAVNVLTFPFTFVTIPYPEGGVDL